MKRLTEGRIEYLKDQFDQLTSEVAYINSGGCGWFALFAYMWFVKNGFNVSIHLITDDYQLEEAIDNIITKGSTPKNTNSHICLKIGKYYVDVKDINSDWESFGKWGKASYCFVDHPLTKSMLKSWLSLPRRYWNTTFDHNEGPTQIKEFFKKLKLKSS